MRYGNQQYSEIMEMPYTRMMALYEEVGDLIEAENTPPDDSNDDD